MFPEKDKLKVLTDLEIRIKRAVVNLINFQTHVSLGYFEINELFMRQEVTKMARFISGTMKKW
jgi:hypothetical protein